MGLLLKRNIAVTVGTVRITGLRMSFRVTRNLKKDPNTAEVSIWNLNRDHRSAFQDTTQTVIIEAGYGQDLGLLFKGDLKLCTSTCQGPDWITTLKTGDGATAFATARINESFAPGTPIMDVIKRVARSLGVGLGDAESKIASGQFREGLTQFINGCVASGQSRDVLENLLRAQGLEYSIQNGNLQILPRGAATQEPVVLLTPSTGLVGSPEAGEDGTIKVKSLLQYQLTPGRKFQVQTSLIPNGLYRIEKASHSGDTHGEPWHSEIEGKRV